MKTSALALAAALGFAAFGGPALAATIPAALITVTQVGANVVVTGSGEIDLDGLTLTDDGGSLPTNGIIWPDEAEIIVGGTGEGSVDIYSGASGPASMGSGSEVVTSNGSGDQFGVGNALLDAPAIYVPAGYVSDTPLTGVSTFEDTTIAKLGLTPGTYTYTWGDPNSLTIEVNGAIPEPSTWAMMALGFAGIGLLAYRKRGTLAAA
jgi:PEP-CTERM motif